jgi:hypothetical protein
MKYLFLDLNKYKANDGTYDPGLLGKHIHFLKQNSDDKTLMLCDIFERGSSTNNYILFINRANAMLEQSKLSFRFILDSLNDYPGLNCKHNISCINWGWAYTYYGVFIDKHPIQTSYNPKSSKGLFLLGKGNKIQRAGLLKKFYESNNLDSILWSFKNNPETLKQIHADFFSDYTDEDFDTVIRVTEKVLDYESTDDLFVHLGFPYDPNLFADTAFSIVSETWIYGIPHIFTEKTWKPIINRHPFIMIGAKENISILKKMGFKVFQKPAWFNKDQNLLDHIVLTTVNMKKRIETDKDYQKQLVDDVEYNYNKFIELAKKDVDQFLDSLNERGNMRLIGELIKAHSVVNPFCFT